MRFSRCVSLTAVIVVLIAVPGLAWGGGFSNGFEKNAKSWFDWTDHDERGWGTITRAASGASAPSGYADGIDAVEGRYHARLGLLAREHDGTAGPYTDWDLHHAYGPSSPGRFPQYGTFTRVAIYLDTEWAQAHPDVRFDWSVASYSAHADRYEFTFVFNAGTDGSGFVVSASRAAGRELSDPANPDNDPVHIAASGWYTFEHRFTHGYNGQIDLVMTIIDSATRLPVGSWSFEHANRLDYAGDVRRGRFETNEIDGLPVDASLRGSRKECEDLRKAECAPLPPAARKDCEDEGKIECRIIFHKPQSDFAAAPYDFGPRTE